MICVQLCFASIQSVGAGGIVVFGVISDVFQVVVVAAVAIVIIVVVSVRLGAAVATRDHNSLVSSLWGIQLHEMTSLFPKAIFCNECLYISASPSRRLLRTPCWYLCN